MSRGVSRLEAAGTALTAFAEGYRSVRTVPDRGLAVRAVAFAGWHLFDRVLAAAVDARWLHGPDAAERDEAAWDLAYTQARSVLLTAFADTYSYSLQQTLHAMGRKLLHTDPEVREVRLALPNKHHFAVDLTPFGQKNDNEVFHAADRPYGLIEGTVLRTVAAAAPAWAWD